MASLKIGDLRSLLERFAGTLEANGSDPDRVGGLRDLVTVFDGCEEKSASAFLNKVRRCALRIDDSAGPPIADVVPTIMSLRLLLEGLATRSLLNGLDSLLDVLSTNAHIPRSVFTEGVRKHVASAFHPQRNRPRRPMDQALIDEYAKRLEVALGDKSEFKALFEQLRSDSRVQQPEAVGIANAFAGRTAASTTRSKALLRIWERHQKLMDFKGQPSTAGKSAA